MGVFSAAHVGNDTGVINRVIDQRDDANLNENGKLPLQQYLLQRTVHHEYFFQRRTAHKYTRCINYLGKRSLIDSA